MNQLLEFADRLPANPRVLEMGTRRWGPQSTSQLPWLREHFPGCRHVGTDCQPGADVDVVCDAHRLTEAFAEGSFDLVLSMAMLEHCERPWVVVEQVARVLAPGGLAFLETHQTFPLHYYPSDYWRFTREAMGVLFCPPAWKVLRCEYQYPAVITPTPAIAPWNAGAKAFLNVWVIAERQGVPA